MNQTDGSVVPVNQTTTTLTAENGTISHVDQSASGIPEHEDTVSVVLVPLVIIGLLIAVTAIVSLFGLMKIICQTILLSFEFRSSSLSGEEQRSRQGVSLPQYIILLNTKKVAMNGSLS